MSTETTLSGETTRFDEDLDNAFQRVRGALTELLGSVDADATRPQDLARGFGLNKNLAWKIARVVAVTDPHAAIPHMPGSIGMKTFFNAMESGGAPPRSVAAARAAVDQFDSMVAAHVGDRSTLQLVLSSTAPHKVPQEHLEATRKMAFQGNSCIWGIQGRVRLASFFIAPSADDETMLDTASMGGVLDVRRLRPSASVPFFMRFAYNDDGTARSGPVAEPIDPSGRDDPLMLIDDFCSRPIPAFRAIGDGTYTRYQLAPGEIGNPGRHTWIYGEQIRSFASIYGDANNLVGEHAVPIQMPVEWAICDLQVHKDLKFALSPRVAAYSKLATGPGPDEDMLCDQLPLAETVQSIGHCPPVVATPLVPRYPEMVQRVYDRMGWHADDFYGFRFVMKYPPMPTAIVMQHDLAVRPTEG
jgi:hypothetical protein